MIDIASIDSSTTHRWHCSCPLSSIFDSVCVHKTIALVNSQALNITMTPPDCVIQELRNLLALHCRELTMTKKAKGADTGNQENMHCQSFHGTESHQSVLDLFLQGNGPYFAAFEKVPIEVNRAGNDSRTDGYMWELKPLLHREPNGRLCVHDPGFTREALRLQKDGQPLSGRILYDKALQVVANYKHALKHYNTFVVANKDKPSGTTIEDMAEWVLRKMHVEFKGGRVKPSGKTARNRAEVNEEDMPANYIFNGYFAFMLFGPRPLSSCPFTCLSTDGKGCEKKSRTTCRKEEAEAKQAEREAGTGGHAPEDYRRGMSLNNKASAAQMAQVEHNNYGRNLRELLNSVFHDARNVLDEYKVISEQIKEAKEMEDHAEVASLRIVRHGLVKEMAACRDRKRECEKQMTEHLAKKPRQLEAHYEQVGAFDGSAGSFTTPKRPTMVSVSRSSDDASRLTVDNSNDSNANENENEEPFVETGVTGVQVVAVSKER